MGGKAQSCTDKCHREGHICATLHRMTTGVASPRSIRSFLCRWLPSPYLVACKSIGIEGKLKGFSTKSNIYAPSQDQSRTKPELGSWGKINSLGRFERFCDLRHSTAYFPLGTAISERFAFRTKNDMCGRDTFTYLSVHPSVHASVHSHSPKHKAEVYRDS